MDKNDIIIINELIKLNVEKAVTKAVQPVIEHLSVNNKKDLKEIKLLLAKIIREGVSSATPAKPKSTFLEQAQLKHNIKKRQPQPIEESYEEDYGTYDQFEEEEDENLLVIKSQTGIRGPVPDSRDVENAFLPDIDAPVLINKNSEVYHAMLESIK